MNTIKLNTIGTPVKKVAGGGASGGGGNYVYYRGTYDDFGESFLVYASVVKRAKYQGLQFEPIGVVMDHQSYYDGIEAVAFDLSMKIINPNTGEYISVGDYIAEPSKDWTQITEEEFYPQQPPKPAHTITVHSDVGEVLTIGYDEGMTWADWTMSDYNTLGWYASSSSIHRTKGSPYMLFDNDFAGDYPNVRINPAEEISASKNYIFWFMD